MGKISQPQHNNAAAGDNRYIGPFRRGQFWPCRFGKFRHSLNVNYVNYVHHVNYFNYFNYVNYVNYVNNVNYVNYANYFNFLNYAKYVNFVKWIGLFSWQI